MKIMIKLCCWIYNINSSIFDNNSTKEGGENGTILDEGNYIDGNSNHRKNSNTGNGEFQ